MKINNVSVVFIVSAASVVLAPGTYDTKTQPLLSHGELSHNTHDIPREQSSSWLSKMVASRKADVILNQARVQAEQIIAEATKAQQKITEQANEMLARVKQQSAEAKMQADQMISDAERLLNFARANVESARIGGAAPLCLEWQRSYGHYKDLTEIERLQKSGYEPFQVLQGYYHYKRCEKWG
ncbi:hypothetical protein MIR68_003687 [Amoeboaphelidium protococcarum]|nr:hypothetical protein MIR68_003687 [Amoeboaphelidium protococcarum]